VLSTYNPHLQHHLMVLPTLNYQAACGYCFGPHEGSSTMTHETLKAIVQWQLKNEESRNLEVTFHDGESLLPVIQLIQMTKRIIS
jgi:sulfatase maturation enzyme AslB (radical SAM superfamily)